MWERLESDPAAQLPWTDLFAVDGTERAAVGVVVADDHPEYRQTVREVIDGLPGFVVVGEAPEGASAVRLVQELRPGLVVMDLQMPLMDGVAATAEITKLASPPHVVVLTASSSSDRLLDAISAGAVGYLLKGATDKEINTALCAALDGGALLSPDVAGALLQHVRQRRAGNPTVSLPPLSEREAKILELLALGHDTVQIAEGLFLSTATVKKHMSLMFETLGVQSRAQAAVLAVRAGLV